MVASFTPHISQMSISNDQTAEVGSKSFEIFHVGGQIIFFWQVDIRDFLALILKHFSRDQGF